MWIINRSQKQNSVAFSGSHNNNSLNTTETVDDTVTVMLRHTENCRFTDLLVFRCTAMPPLVSPNAAFLPWIHCGCGRTLELARELTWIGDGANDAELCKTMWVTKYAQMGHLQSTVATPYLQQRQTVHLANLPVATSAVSGALLVYWTRTLTGQHSLWFKTAQHLEPSTSALWLPELSTSTFKYQLKTHLLQLCGLAPLWPSKSLAWTTNAPTLFNLNSTAFITLCTEMWTI